MGAAKGSPRGLARGDAFEGEFRGPPSKSIAQRAILAAGLARGTTSIRGLGPRARESSDVAAALGVAAARGARLRFERGGLLELRGAPPSESGPASPELEVGEAGTLARLCLATAALAAPTGTRSLLRASGSLLRRSSPALVAALEAAGVELEGEPWPRTVAARQPPEELTLAGPGSSQEVSALLLALCAHAEPRRLVVVGAIPSRPYVELTRRVLAAFGARIEERRGEGRTTFHVIGPLVAPERELTVDPDASAAAVALAAACLAGGSVRVAGLGPGSSQGDVRIVEHLAAFGCQSSSGEDFLSASGAPLHPADLDLSDQPDLAPVLAVVAAASTAGGGSCTLSGLATLPGKESSRIDVLAGGLGRAGWEASAGRDSLVVGPRRGTPAGALVLDPSGDHRMAFAFALLGLLRPETYVSDPGCVAKSWPGFWHDMETTGFQVVRAPRAAAD